MNSSILTLIILIFLAVLLSLAIGIFVGFAWLGQNRSGSYSKQGRDNAERKKAELAINDKRNEEFVSDDPIFIRYDQHENKFLFQFGKTVEKPLEHLSSSEKKESVRILLRLFEKILVDSLEEKSVIQQNSEIPYKSPESKQADNLGMQNHHETKVDPKVNSGKIKRQKSEPKVEKEDLSSIAEQVDVILQQMLLESPYRLRDIKVVEGAGGGVSVWVDGKQYSEIDEIQDENVRSLIHEAAEEWNRRMDKTFSY